MVKSMKPTFGGLPPPLPQSKSVMNLIFFKSIEKWRKKITCYTVFNKLATDLLDPMFSTDRIETTK